MSSPAARGAGLTQVLTIVKLASTPARVKPELVRQHGKQLRWVGSQRDQAARRANCVATSIIPTTRCGPACRAVWEGSGLR